MSATVQTAENEMPDGVMERIDAVEKREDWTNQRLIRMEVALQHTRDDVAEIKTAVASLAAIAQMGKGALWLSLRLGGLAAGVAAIYEAVRIALKS